MFPFPKSFHLALALLLTALLLAVGLPASAFATDWQSAADAFAAGRYDAAVEAFAAYVEAHPETPQGHYMLGLGLTRLGRAGEARASLLRAVKLADENSAEETRYRLALAQADLQGGGDALETLAALDPAALGDEMSSAYVKLLSLAARRSTSPARARDVVRRAAAALDERSLWLALGGIEQKRGNAEAAFAAFDAAHALAPADVELARRAVTVAFQAAERATDPGARRDWYGRGFEVASRLATAAPSALAWRWGGEALMGSQDWAEAATWFARAAEREPSALLSYYQGRCLLAGNEPDAETALARLDAALEQEPDEALRASIYASRGVAYHHLEDFERAAEAYRLAGNGEKVAEMGHLGEIKKGNDEWERFRAECERKALEAEKFRAENEDLQGTEGWQMIEDEIARQLSGCEEVLNSVAAR